jgi:hypothetical protein
MVNLTDAHADGSTRRAFLFSGTPLKLRNRSGLLIDNVRVSHVSR